MSSEITNNKPAICLEATLISLQMGMQSGEVYLPFEDIFIGEESNSSKLKMLLMEEIWLTNWWGKYLTSFTGGFIYLNWCRISSIDCSMSMKNVSPYFTKRREHRKFHIFPKSRHVVKEKGTYQVSPVIAAHNLGSKTPSLPQRNPPFVQFAWPNRTAGDVFLGGKVDFFPTFEMGNL